MSEVFLVVLRLPSSPMPHVRLLNPQQERLLPDYQESGPTDTKTQLDTQGTHDVTIRRVHATVVAGEKQVLHGNCTQTQMCHRGVFTG